MISRRKFMKAVSAGTVLTAVGTGLYAWRIEPHWIDITGDLMSCRGDEEIAHVMRLLEGLQPAPLGSFVILGNHDYAHTWSNLEVADALVGELEARDFTVLRNASTVVEGLEVVGLDDLWSPMFGPYEVLHYLDPEKPHLALCHNPDAADFDVWSDYQGWVLCGHTHGGQCDPPLFPPPMLPVSNKAYASGEVDLGDGRHLYVNRGIGYLMRVRFNARPEITVHRLTAA